MKNIFLLIVISTLLISTGCKSVMNSTETASTTLSKPDRKASSPNEDKEKPTTGESRQSGEFQGFVENKANGSIAAVSRDKTTMFLFADNPKRTINGIHLPSNRGKEVYKCPADTEIMSVATNSTGTKLFIRESKRLGVIQEGSGSRGMRFVEMEFHSWVLDLSTGKKVQINEVREAWWGSVNDVLYGLTGKFGSDMNLVKFSSVDYASKKIKSFANVNLQFQSSPDDNTVFLADNKGEGGVTLMRIDLTTGKTVYSKKTGRMLISTDTCAVISGSGDNFFWYDEMTEKTYLTDIKSKSTKIVFNTRADIREIKWLPGDQQAIFRMGDSSRGGNWAAVLKIYDIKSNTFKQIKSVNEPMGSLFYSQTGKKLYYSYIEGGDRSTLEGGKRITTFWALDI